MLGAIDSHINTNSEDINKSMNRLHSKAVQLVEAELLKQQENLKENAVPLSHGEKAAQFEYNVLADLKPGESDERKIALKLEKLKKILASQQKN